MNNAAARWWAGQGLDRTHETALDVLMATVGVYSTAPTTLLALTARLPSFSSKELTSLVESKMVVRLRAMRTSGYLLPTEYVPLMMSALGNRIIAKSGSLLRRTEPKLVEDVSDAIEQLLQKEHLTAAEVRQRLSLPAGTWNELVKFVTLLMSSQARLVRTTVNGGWKSDLNRYTAWDNWIPHVKPFSLPEPEARHHLAELYFKTHSPASIDDFSWWAGLPLRDAKEAADGVEQEDDDIATPRGVRLLPVWDGLLMGRKDRTSILTDDLRPYVFDRDGNATSTVAIDGKIGGLWDRVESNKGLLIRVAFFGKKRRGIEDEAELIATATGLDRVRVQYHEMPGPLDQAPRNRFLSPLTEAKAV